MTTMALALLTPLLALMPWGTSVGLEALDCADGVVRDTLHELNEVPCPV